MSLKQHLYHLSILFEIETLFMRCSCLMEACYESFHVCISDESQIFPWIQMKTILAQMKIQIHFRPYPHNSDSHDSMLILAQCSCAHKMCITTSITSERSDATGNKSDLKLQMFSDLLA